MPSSPTDVGGDGTRANLKKARNELSIVREKEGAMDL